MGMKFGDPAAPLLVSVRSGAAISMPGMMDTVLNLGLNDEASSFLCNFVYSVHALLACLLRDRSFRDMFWYQVVAGLAKKSNDRYSNFMQFWGNSM